MHLTGIDLSRRSVDYGRAQAAAHNLAIRYIHGDYLEMTYRDAFDAALRIYGDLCTLAPEPHDRLLGVMHMALKPGEAFALAVTTPLHHAQTAALNRWEVRDAGFWWPHPHRVPTQGVAYPERDLFLEQYIVIEADGSLAVHHNWFQDYTRHTITDLLQDHGFRIAGVWGDLAGNPYSDGSE